MSPPESILYKRATFVTRLPAGYLYSPSHLWLARAPDGASRWQVGLTKFALRMLGELVDLKFEPPVGTPVRCGDIIGHIEGFKAISDLYCVADGTFLGGNPALEQDVEHLAREPYRAWLFGVEGTPDSRCLTVDGYRELLDATIDRILAKQTTEEEP